MDFYPVNLNIENKLCVIVGGGNVARRKILSLLGCGAIIKVISPDVLPEIVELASTKKIALYRRQYIKNDLDGAFLCFATTNIRAVQAQIAHDADESAVLINSVDDPAGCDFQVPSKVRRGAMLFTVSTGGGSPAFSKKIRKELEEKYGEEYGLYVKLLHLVREEVVDGESSEENKLLFEKLLESEQVFNDLLKKDWAGLTDRLQNILPQKINCPNIVNKLQTTINAEKE